LKTGNGKIGKKEFQGRGAIHVLAREKRLRLWSKKRKSVGKW